jgi:DNA-binding NarL/FixJ family response regulator
VPKQHRSAEPKTLESKYSPDGENTGHRGHGQTVTMVTPRQMEIVQFLADGATDREIADTLSLSIRTVSNTLHRLYDRIGVSSRVRLAVMCRDGQIEERPNGHARRQPATRRRAR